MLGMRRARRFYPEDEPTGPMRGGGGTAPHRLRPDEYDDFLGSADARGAYVFDEIDRLLEILRKQDPVRVWSLKRDIKWLRYNAKLVGYGWGK